jgi:hypothetical protein
VLSQDDIRRGMSALLEALGPDKARLFLAAVSRGALDQHFPGRASAFIRQNPELVEAAAKTLGTFLGQLAKGRRRKANPIAEVVVGLIGAGAPAQPPPPPQVTVHRVDRTREG